MNRLTTPAQIGVIALLILFGAGGYYLLAQGHDSRGGGQGGGMRQPPGVDEIFAREDKNEDGLISQDEFGGPAEHFSGFDTDGDGYLTREEVTASLQNPPDRNGGGQGRGNGPRPGQDGPPELDFTTLDANGDGMVSTEEFTGPTELFALIDTDEDGVITEAELDDAAEWMPNADNETRRR